MTTKDAHDFYPLSPMQQGMLFHTLLAPAAGIYCEQLTCTLSGDLNVAAFGQAWQRLVTRHPILRTAFVGESLKEPVQVVHEGVEFPLEQQDWRGLTQEEQGERVEAYLQTERRRGFALAEPPLMRIALFRTAERAYQFAWSYHHLLLDGWSVPMLLQEVFAIYDAVCRGVDPVLERRRPYRDYIVWLRRQNLSQAEAYWRETLKDFATPTPLVVDRALESIGAQEEGHAEEETQLCTATTAALQALARQHHLTLNTIVQGAWALLLSRYSGEDDVLFGTTVSGRPTDLPGSETMIGLFINTLPVRVRVPADARVAPWLKALQTDLVTMRQYEYSPLIQVQGWSAMPRGIPMFESILVFENYPVSAALQGQGGSLTIQSIGSVEQTNYPLTIVAGPGAELLLRIVYDRRRFDASIVRRMLGHLGALLTGMAADPNGLLAELELVTETERRQLLVEWNSTARRLPLDRCVPELFEAQAHAQPEAVAVTSGVESLTYGALNRRANQLAHYLRKEHVGPDVLVGLCVEPSPEMVVAALGVLKAGGAYVPMDPSYPMERLAFMLQDTRSPVLLTQERLLGRLPHSAARAICLDSDWDLMAGESEENPDNAALPQHLAYVIYTSGSTGTPKGVQIEHAGLLNLVLWHRRAFGVTELDRSTQIAGPGFDAVVWELWPSLTAGACIYIPENEVRTSPARLRDWLVANGITISFLPTPLAEAVLALDWPDDVALHTLLTGGDKLSRYPAPSVPFRLVNNYGPTESTVVTTSGRVLPQDQYQTPPAIGFPIDNLQVYVLDRQSRPVPIGVPGELHVGGAGLARGYLNHPELTAEKFVSNPFVRTPAGNLPAAPVGSPGTRLYKTGDLVRYRADGAIEFLGRIDQQVKIRGLRIELGEIETVLGQHPAVQQAVVLAQDAHGDEPDAEHEPAEKRLVAYVVCQEEHRPGVGELRDLLLAKLPAYMVPAAFVMVEALPMTANGKVDRKALPLLEGERLTSAVAFVPPRSSVEQMLAELWARVLLVERVGRHDNFFESGGHSLSATQLISRVRTTFHIDMPLRDIFEAPTLAGLAQRVEAAQRAAFGLAQSAPAIMPVRRDQPLPLSFAQQRLWFLDQLEADSPLYNIAFAIRLEGPLEVTALEEALNGIVQRHESLRTTFPTADGKPVLIIAQQLLIPLLLRDLTDLPAAERQDQVSRLAGEEARRPFDLAKGPLLRTTLLRLAAEDHVALLVMHHIVSDGWSMGVFMSELTALYKAICDGKPAPLPELPVQYADFGYWQRHWLQGEVLETQLTYWKQQLASLPPLLELATDRPRSAVQTWRGATENFEICPEVADKLKLLCRKEGATLFMLLLAAFESLLYRYTGQEDIAIGTPIANRNRAEIEGLIGFFVNTLVMRTDLSGQPSFRQALGRVRETALGAYTHQDVPFEMLVDEVQPERTMSHSPLFQVMFVLQNAPMELLDLPDLKLSSLDTDTGMAAFDLTLTIIEAQSGLAGSFVYNTDLFDVATVHRMAEHFRMLLNGILANPDESIASLPLLTEGERRQILVDWNNTDADFPREACLQHLFEAQVCRTPEANAVFYEGDVLTFAELNRQANQLAHYLRTLGVGPDVLVGLCMQRSPELIIGLLAILKAGGAYLPLDPAYPAERLAFMLADTQVAVLVSHRNLLARLPAGAAHVVYLDAPDQRTRLAQAPITNPTGATSAANLAYVIYTSGSTGKPKGVMIPHRAALNLWTGLQRVVYATQPGAPRRVSLNAPLAFDASVKQWITLLGGHCLYIIPEDTRLDGRALLAYLRTNRLDVFDCVPSQLKPLLQEGLLDGSGWMPPAILPGGEAIDETTWQILRQAAVTDSFNMYGPTECTVDAAICRVKDSPVPSIGRPICNMQLYILDPQLQLVPVGVPGELHIGGVGVARGYLNRPDLTAVKFIPGPYQHDSSAQLTAEGLRLYKTGDLARYRPDGNVEFLGRIDQQVKVRGYRIELGEIEVALAQHPAARDVAVVVREGIAADDCSRGQGPRLVAYIALAQNDAPTVSEWRSFLRGTLPEYMVPSAFVTLTEMPRLPNGKVNRAALPAPDPARPDLAATYLAPSTPEEKVLAGIWAQLLGIEQVGVHDNFFELGGDSILAIQVVARANQAGLRLTPKELFQNPVIQTLAQTAGRASIVCAEQGMVTGPVALTPIQHRHFEHNVLAPQHWNTSMFLEIDATLNRALVEQTLKQLLLHHDALRLRFCGSATGWQQVNAGVEDSVPLSYIDLSGVPSEKQTQAIESAADVIQRSFDLAEAPLLRVACFDLGAQQSSRLLMIFHHLVMDGVSWRIFIDDFQTIYRQLTVGEPVRLAPKTTSFQYWSRQLSQYAQSQELCQELDYWLEMGAKPTSQLPVDYAGGANLYGSTQSITASLTPEETRILLQRVPSVYGTQINDALLTALARAFSRWTGERTLRVELEGHGREPVIDDVDLSRTIGWFTSVFPVLVDLGDADEPRVALQTVKEQLRRIPNRGIGYGLLRYLYADEQVRSQLRSLPAPEVNFNYLGQFDQLPTTEWFPFRIAAESAGPDQDPQGTRNAVLNFIGIVTGGELQIKCLYSENLHKRATIEMLLDNLMQELRLLPG